MALVGSAHLIAGVADGIAYALEALQNEGISTEGNPDLSVRSYSLFGIDEARELRDKAVLAAARGQGRVFVVQTPSMTTEAQNALLKTVEEPPEGTLFFFIVPSPEMLLPTLRSRMQPLRIDVTITPQPLAATFSINAPTVLTYPDPDTFLRSSPARRLELVAPLLEKGESRDIASILMFLSSLERKLHTVDGTEKIEGLTAVYRARKYAGDRGALLKPLLEQLSLIAPVLS